MREDLFLVPPDVFESCNFSNITNEYGEMDNSSVLWLAEPEDMWNENRTQEFVFDIEDWSEYVDDLDNNDLFGQLISQKELYFTSSTNWDVWWGYVILMIQYSIFIFLCFSIYFVKRSIM